MTQRRGTRGAGQAEKSPERGALGTVRADDRVVDQRLLDFAAEQMRTTFAPDLENLALRVVRWHGPVAGGGAETRKPLASSPGTVPTARGYFAD